MSISYPAFRKGLAKHSVQPYKEYISAFHDEFGVGTSHSDEIALESYLLDGQADEWLICG